MTDCPPVRIAKAVAVAINAAADGGATFTRAFQAVYGFGDTITKLEAVNEADGLLVDVMPHMQPGWNLLANTTRRHTAKVKVGLRRRIEPTDRNADGSVNSDEVTGYCNLLYEILNLFAAGVTATNSRPLTTYTEAVWDPRTPPEIQLYDEEQLKSGLYVGWLHLPFLAHEGMA